LPAGRRRSEEDGIVARQETKQIGPSQQGENGCKNSKKTTASDRISERALIIERVGEREIRWLPAAAARRMRGEAEERRG
jgi:hypothetical protein